MRRNTSMALALAALTLSSLFAGCIGRDPLLVALSAPKASSGMTLFLVTETSVLDKLSDASKSAEYAVYFGNKLVYPPGGRGASFPVDGRSGSVFIPYHLFVIGNGDYDVLVTYSGTQTRARVTVEKWVEYVYLHPFDKGNIVVIEAALASATGGRPEDRVLATGELVMALHYHGKDGTEDRTLGSVVTTTRNDQPSTSLDVPKSRFNQGGGYYSVVPTFHNLEAKDNVQVAGDPTMANRAPPWNWIYIDGL